MAKSEDFLTLYVDPGEETGWALSQGVELLGGGQTPMWAFADEVAAKLSDPRDDSTMFWNEAYYDGTPSIGTMELPIKRIVCEDFRIYPWAIYGPNGRPTHALDFNPVRTARLIGGLTLLSRMFQIDLFFQPASIKGSAVAAGAEELFVTPLHPNRHQNDARMHFVYFKHTKLLGLPTPEIKNEGVEDAQLV